MTSEGERMLAMHVSAEYGYTALFLSLVAIVLASSYLWRVIRSYRIHHDHRAAVSLIKALTLAVIALGLVLSASGLVLSSSGFSVAGLSMARGAILVLLATLVLADVRP